jgi:hypothetical protein
MVKDLPSCDELKRLFKIENGKLINKINRGSHSKKDMLAGWIDETGYQKVRLNGSKYQAHRIIWKMAYNEEPKGFVDHIDGDRSNNNLKNLRVVDHKENSKNRGKSKNNTSGFTGVSWNKKLEKWVVNIKINGVLKYLGCFDNIEQAVQVRKNEQNSLNFSVRHGV